MERALFVCDAREMDGDVETEGRAVKVTKAMAKSNVVKFHVSEILQKRTVHFSLTANQNEVNKLVGPGIQSSS